MCLKLFNWWAWPSYCALFSSVVKLHSCTDINNLRRRVRASRAPAGPRTPFQNRSCSRERRSEHTLEHTLHRRDRFLTRTLHVPETFVRDSAFYSVLHRVSDILTRARRFSARGSRRIVRESVFKTWWKSQPLFTRRYVYYWLLISLEITTTTWTYCAPGIKKKALRLQKWALCSE